ncbi:hypothetical protein [Natrinema salifodinae]|uniref:Exonuclease n=1 Tax=Natrinema salifodinae TaxID=1202768 RepID=A0A1I0NHY1_9EURY|nr:hypothetical protein [Natrinema salifodinae]SEW01102.1 hypothetical protein SAMN05216285_1760 [Natrinema salifodinae]
MATEGRSAEPASATSALESAGFVRIVARADGDALAATGLLATALADRDTPFQVTVGRTVTERSERVRAPTAEGDATVVVGTADADAASNLVQLPAVDRPATLEAVDLVRELGATPDPVCALAGLVAGGGQPGAGESEWLLETARERGLVERRPGVAVPTANPVDGLASSTLLRAPWSGDPDAAREAIGDAVGDDPAAFDADDHRELGSLVALDVVGADESSDATSESIARALRPYATPDGVFATLGGFADVLDATARAEPGTGTALAMGHDVRAPALDAWRKYGRRAHEALDAASTGRYDGLFVVGIDDEDGPVEAVARIAAAYRSPEPTVLAIGDGDAAIATRQAESLGATVEGVARELGGAYDVGHRRGYLRFDPETDESTIIATVRELL